MDKNEYFTPKIKKFIFVFLITIFISPGLFLNLPPINFFTRINHDDNSGEGESEEYSYIKNFWMTGKTSILSAIFHAALLMLIIFALDKIY